MTTFTKIDNTCSNIFLIDEGLCLANTLNLMNYNVASLSNAVFNISKYDHSWFNMYTIFTAYSAKWLQTATNMQDFSASWIKMSTTVSILSSDWIKEYTLYYPNVIDINTWYGSDQTPSILNWINNVYNSSTLPTVNGQVISVVIYLSQNQPFSFRFNRSYNEPCTPNQGGGNVQCNGCSKPFQGCNHHGGNAGVGPCTNLYDACSVSNGGPSYASVSCDGTGSKTLNIGLNRSSVDSNIARTIHLKYKNINNVWTAI